MTTAVSSPNVTSTWTGRKRLLTALTCGTPDRVPINTYEMPGRNSRDWYNRQPSYASLMDFIREHTDAITNWGPGRKADMRDDDIQNTGSILGSAHQVPMDVTEEQIDATRRRVTRILHTPQGDLRSITEHDTLVHTTWQIEHWCKDTADVDKALSVPYLPIRHQAEDYDAVREELGDHGLIMSSLADPAYMVADLMSFQDYVMWLYEDTDHFARAVDVVAERVMTNLADSLRTRTVDLYRICGPEYMTPPYARPEMFRRFMVPHVKAMTELIHRYGGKVRLHCHGKIAQVLDMFFETGCDATDPCEPPPDGDLPLAEVKRRCAAQGVSVWGNMELKVLEYGSKREVRETVIQCMRDAKEGGGYVLLPTAAPINVPLAAKTEANYRTMIETALEYGRY